MKKIIATILSFVLLFSMTSCGKKVEEPEQRKDSEGLSYQTNYDGTCSVTGIGSCEDTDLVIPSQNPETGEIVVRIENYAFQWNQDITSIAFPNTILEIGYYAFASCTALEQVLLPDRLQIISPFAFSRCSSVVWVYLGGYLQEIGDSAFAGCTSMKYAFYRGTGLSWSFVSVGALNSSITMEGVLHFYSQSRPQVNGYYWYYSSGSFRIW